MCVKKTYEGEYDRLKDKECRLKVVQYREGRSLDANAYFLTYWLERLQK